MRHALTVALQDYEGALVVVSHDRYLLRSVTDRLVVVADGRVQPFDGDLDDYPAWLAARRSQAARPAEPEPAGVNRRDQRRQDAERRRQLQPLKKRVQTLETEVTHLSSQLAALRDSLADPALYDGGQKDRLTQLLKEQGRIQQALNEAENAWLEASEAFETASLAAETP
jgi:ATP-binding cassette, subfamily F, member 3